MKKLISMVDFCLEQRKTHTGDFEDYSDLICRYAKFLKQPLALWMFVPCDEDGVFLEEKKPFQDNYYKFQEARERCLFEGFSEKDAKFVLFANETVEDLIEFNLKTTATAQKQIFG